MSESAGMEAAIAILAARGVVTTPLGQRILATICSQPKPIGAYEIADRLGRHDKGRPMTPNSVYRILKTLIESGAVQHIESQRTFVARTSSSDTTAALLCVCDGCGQVEQVAVPSVEGDIAAAASGSGFQLRRQIIEATGLCRDCSRS